MSGESSSSSSNSKSPCKRSISLALLMGLPASGKTTLAKDIVKSYSSAQSSSNSMNISTILISYDDFVPHEVQASCAVEAQEEEGSGESRTKGLRRKFLQCVEYLVEYAQHSIEDDVPLTNLKFEKLSLVEDGTHFTSCISNFADHFKSLLCRNSPVIFLIDDNHYYVSMRSDFYNLAKHKGLGFCILYCKTPVKTCRERNALREEGLRVPDKTIVEMSLKLEEPNPMNNQCDQFCLQIEEENLPLIVEILNNSVKHPIVWSPPPDRTEEIERDRRICNENEIHQADIILRKWINKEIGLSFAKGLKTKEYAKELNNKKSKVLQKLRNGEFKISARTEQDVEFHEEVIKLVSSVDN